MIGRGRWDTGREYTLGLRLGRSRSDRMWFELTLEGTRREAMDDDRDPSTGSRS